jgi:hypothetical protein
MSIDKGTFLLMTAALAGGGVAGYVAGDARDDRQTRVEPPPAAPPPPAADERAADGRTAEGRPPEGQAADDRALARRAVDGRPVDETGTDDEPVAAREPAAPACSDDVGTPPECPVDFPGPSEEGLCKGGVFWAGKRCADFKATMKPRVAQAAVECLRNLKGGSCDAQRANACGHMALMTACQEEVPETHASVTSASLANAPALDADEASVAGQCLTIVRAAAGTTPGVAFADCMRTLSGMNELGRRNAVACMQSPTTNALGLLGCEALATPPPPPAG